MARVLVTGGAGFLGSHVVDHLLAHGHDVTVLDDLSGGFRDNVPDGALFVEGSITDAALVERLFATLKFEYVYHLAAYAAEGLSPHIRRFNYTNNVVGSATIINACLTHSTKRLVFTSSVAVYGHGTPPFHEFDDLAPIDPYGIAKAAVERDIEVAAMTHGLSYTIFRPHNIYGPRQHIGDRYRNVVGIFVRQALAKEPFTIFGDGLQVRAFSYVTPVAARIAASAWMPECHNMIFNIGGDYECSVIALAQHVGAACGRGTWVAEHLAPRHEARDATCDHRKLREVFAGFPDEPPLREGLALMVDWARTVGPRQSNRIPTIEMALGLPEGWHD